VESDIWQALKTQYPGQVQVLGPDVFFSGTNGSLLAQFRANAGNLTFPLLRDCGDGGLADTNLVNPYIQRDNYVVINKQGVIRYHAADFWPYGNRYHPDELLGTVDSLVNHNAGVGDGPAGAWSIAALPNPARGALVLQLANPTRAPVVVRVRIVDLSGRRIADLPPRVAPSGYSRVSWDGRDARGQRVPAGLYMVQAELGKRSLVLRVALTR